MRKVIQCSITKVTIEFTLKGCNVVSVWMSL